MSNLYMFALMPPADLAQKIGRERISFAENYNCFKALKPPVHITMYEPFEQNDHDFEVNIKQLHKWAEQEAPFAVKLDNFSFFENPKSPVFIIKVIKDNAIKQLRTGLIKELKKYIDLPDEEYLENGKLIPNAKARPFNPHFTIGYRDVPPAMVLAIKQAYARRRFEDTFLCDTLYLWSYYDKNWHVLQAFPLAGRKDQLSLF